MVKEIPLIPKIQKAKSYEELCGQHRKKSRCSHQKGYEGQSDPKTSLLNQEDVSPNAFHASTSDRKYLSCFNSKTV